MLKRRIFLLSPFIILSAAAVLLLAALEVHFAIGPGAAQAETNTKERGETEETFDYKINGETKHGTRKVLILKLGDGVTMELVRIPHGTFLMGSPDSDKDAKADEKPQHQVTITKDFYLGKYVVTQEQYQSLMGKNPSYFSPNGPRKNQVKTLETGCLPVEEVSWNDAQAFSEKLSEKAHRRAGLPTEAQWEYACRAGTTTRFPDGDKMLTESDANFSIFNVGHTSVVGSYPANAFGLYDMTGNVWEWCSDYYDEKYYGNSPKEDPENLKKSDARILRGGSFYSGDPLDCRAANRGEDAPTRRYVTFGFRVRVRTE